MKCFSRSISTNVESHVVYLYMFSLMSLKSIPLLKLICPPGSLVRELHVSGALHQRYISFFFPGVTDKACIYFNFQTCYREDSTPSSSTLCSKPISAEDLERTRTLIGLFKNNMHATPPFKCFKSRLFPLYMSSVE